MAFYKSDGKWEIKQATPPTPEEAEAMEAEYTENMRQIEEAEKSCTYSHAPEDLDPEDGCIYCGYYAK